MEKSRLNPPHAKTEARLVRTQDKTLGFRQRVRNARKQLVIAFTSLVKGSKWGCGKFKVVIICINEKSYRFIMPEKYAKKVGWTNAVWMNIKVQNPLLNFQELPSGSRDEKSCELKFREVVKYWVVIQYSILRGKFLHESSYLRPDL